MKKTRILNKKDMNSFFFQKSASLFEGICFPRKKDFLAEPVTFRPILLYRKAIKSKESFHPPQRKETKSDLLGFSVIVKKIGQKEHIGLRGFLEIIAYCAVNCFALVI